MINCDLEYCDSSWRPYEDVAHSDYCTPVLDYLNKAVSSQNPTDAAIFHGLVTEAVLNDDYFKRASRAVELAGILGGRALATNILVKVMQEREPLLDEAEIRTAIAWHR